MEQTSEGIVLEGRFAGCLNSQRLPQFAKYVSSGDASEVFH
jgi:hypothetical protein